MAAAHADPSARGFRRLLAHCEAMERLTAVEPACPRRRLEDALGLELATRLVGALARRSERAAVLV